MKGWQKPERSQKLDALRYFNNGQAYAWSGTRMEWMAGCPKALILVTTITLERLVKRGYESMITYYKNVSPQFMNRCIRGPYAVVMPWLDENM
jgi:RNA-directed DNA polymerase